MRFLFAIVCVIAGSGAAFFGQPYVSENPDVVLIIITVLTVFAGFLIAIIAIIGDPAMIPEGSWRAAEGGRNCMEQRLVRHVVLFLFYLVSIGVLFAGVIVGKALAADLDLRIWIERAYLFCGVTSFLLTFALPFSLLDLQRARYDAETKKRRKKVGLDGRAVDGDG